MTEAERMEAVRGFIAVEMLKPYEKGVTCCGATVDKWVRRLTGFSPLAAAGRQLRDAEDAIAILSEPQSFVVTVNRVARSAGFKKTREPIPGDVGIVAHNDILYPAVHAGNIWFSRHSTGAIAIPIERYWKAWRIE
ncbi:hypothetical protein [Mesorhizobium sp.]|uniref:DUF6950 family protein n=1 Tax=Mesorhizobium sp. TaxID=1871066 RepID=UPI000FE4EDAB|nr:hypothetical protein [Mesorhizobium sp.]RWO08237.1 MAG: hypothetical protein EOS15_29935 [Mesorhizobium sp.]